MGLLPITSEMFVRFCKLKNVLFIFLLIDGAWKTISPGAIMQDKISKARDIKYALVPRSEKEMYDTQEIIV